MDFVKKEKTAWMACRQWRRLVAIGALWTACTKCVQQVLLVFIISKEVITFQLDTWYNHRHLSIHTCRKAVIVAIDKHYHWYWEVLSWNIEDCIIEMCRRDMFQVFIGFYCTPHMSLEWRQQKHVSNTTYDNLLPLSPSEHPCETTNPEILRKTERISWNSNSHVRNCARINIGPKHWSVH